MKHDSALGAGCGAGAWLCDALLGAQAARMIGTAQAAHRCRCRCRCEASSGCAVPKQRLAVPPALCACPCMGRSRQHDSAVCSCLAAGADATVPRTPWAAGTEWYLLQQLATGAAALQGPQAGAQQGHAVHRCCGIALPVAASSMSEMESMCMPLLVHTGPRTRPCCQPLQQGTDGLLGCCVEQHVHASHGMHAGSACLPSACNLTAAACLPVLTPQQEVCQSRCRWRRMA